MPRPVISSRRVILNADDFGLTPGINAGIIEAHTSGIVSSTSLMVRAPAAEAAASAAAQCPTLSVGLHLDLGEWEFVGGEWVARYERAPLTDGLRVAAEVNAQLERFRRLTGRNPTHVDSHQHAHQNEPLRSIVLDLARQIGVPVRHFSPNVVYVGDFYGQNETGDAFPERLTPRFLCGLIESVGDGITELCCHPAQVVDFDSTYAAERLSELACLRDPSVRAAMDSAGIALVSFADVEAGRE
ncbi:MAG: ChbG/HpnK family deacetylase [Gemmatimonadaceae bacterium]